MLSHLQKREKDTWDMEKILKAKRDTSPWSLLMPIELKKGFCAVDAFVVMKNKNL